MSEVSLRCLPEGRLVMQGEWQRVVATAWANSEAEGVLALTLGEWAAGDDVVWLREWGRAFMTRLCQVREMALVGDPSAEAVTEHILRCPGFSGAEYVSAELLVRLWREMMQAVEKTCGGELEAWLLTTASAWSDVGRVTLHLAENKQDAVRPFAFIATYAERLTAGGRLQHLPLARALQQYQSRGDQAALDRLLKPLREAAACSGLVKRLLETKQIFQALAWTPVQAFELVKDLMPLRASGLVVKVPNWWKSGKPTRPVVQVVLENPTTSSVGTGAMLAFKLNISMNGEPLTAEELEKIKAAGAGLISLRGQWVEVDDGRLTEVMNHWQRVQRLHADGGVSFHQGMRWLSGFGEKGSAVDLQGAGEMERTPWSEVVAGGDLEQALRQLRQPELAVPPRGLNASLRPYQLKGLHWLKLMNQLGLGACLADDMGLGKTLQVIAMIQGMREQGEQKPVLVVCPASLVGNWRAECEKFAPGLRVFVAHRSSASLEELADLQSMADKADVVICTYLFVKQREDLRAIHWSLVVLDEAQAIKNAGSGQTKAVKTLQAQSRLVLTGTPVENRAGDLWSLFDFLNPGLLGGATAFANHLKARTSERGVDYGPLRRLVAPYILRRMKTDKSVIADLPEKIEMKERCYLSKKQATLYAKLVEELKRQLADPMADEMARKGRVLSFLMKFKQVCNHPSHFNGDGQFKPEDSGKFQRLEELGRELAERQERVLVFTQFQEMCEPLAAHLQKVFGREGLILHGGTPVGKRAGLVERFQRADGPPFFVISVKAGGTGLTLTAASQVIHFDRWWNPAVENQATDRAFRIGQKRNVLVHKFVVQGTIEERVDRLLDEKRALSDQLLASSDAELPLTELTNEELLQVVALDIESATI
jgi:superfamily II DNA or RNA helicase